jgi:hypothetical protein
MSGSSFPPHEFVTATSPRFLWCHLVEHRVDVEPTRYTLGRPKG